MIAKLNLSALHDTYARIRPSHLRDEKEKEDDKKEESDELNRYVISRKVCKLLNDYSDGPDFVKEDHNFSTLKSLTEDDWKDICEKIEKWLQDEWSVSLKIDLDYDWTKEDKREIKDFVDYIESHVFDAKDSDEEDAEPSNEALEDDLDDIDDDEKDDKKSSKKDKEEEESEDDEKDEKKSKSKKEKDEEDDSDDSDDDEEDSDEEDDTDEDEDEEDSDDDDDESDSKSKKDKKSKSKDKDDEEDEEDESDEEESDDEDEPEEDEEDDDKEKDKKSEEFLHILNTCASKYPQISWDSQAILNDVKHLQIFHNYLHNLGEVSNENMGTGLLKVFIGVTDTFLRIGNTFKTNIFKFYKDLKRSEIRYYYESHTTMCLKAESVPITQVSNVKVPIPNGMKGTYQNACMSLQQVYTMLDILSYGQGVLSALIDFRRKLMRSEDYKSTLVPITNLVKQRETSLNGLKASADKVFTQQHTAMEVAFTDAYKTMKEFKDARLSLLEMEPYLASTKRLVQMVDDIDTVLADITSYLTEDKEVDKALITDMINIVKYMGVSFDIYGVTTTRQMSVEHNHIGAIGRVWSTIQ